MADAGEVQKRRRRYQKSPENMASRLLVGSLVETRGSVKRRRHGTIVAGRTAGGRQEWSVQWQDADAPEWATPASLAHAKGPAAESLPIAPSVTAQPQPASHFPPAPEGSASAGAAAAATTHGATAERETSRVAVKADG